MKVEPLGEAAFLLRDLFAPAYDVAASLNASGWPGLIEAVASYDTVGVYVDPDRFDARPLDTYSPTNRATTSAKVHQIPVCYEEGPDLAEAAERLGLEEAALIEQHSAATYRCFAVGFCPGFPYLGYLSDAIAGLPRRPSPRVRVEPGSVAITGRQTGIYPLPRPGGWWLIGRTPLTLVDPDSGYFPIEAGDEVRFVPIGREEFAARMGERL